MDHSYLDALARLETGPGGSKTIKGPNGEDSNNLFNIKDMSGSGSGFYQEDPNEVGDPHKRYRTYPSKEASKADLLSLLERKYPKALLATTPVEFATALKEGGYATDPEYVKKFEGVYNSMGKAASPAEAVKSAGEALIPAPEKVIKRPEGWVPPDVAPTPKVAQEPAEKAPQGAWDQFKAVDAFLSQDPDTLHYDTIMRLSGDTPEFDGPPEWYAENQGKLESQLISEDEVESLREMQYAGKTNILLRLQQIIDRRNASKALADVPLSIFLAGSLTAMRNSPVDLGAAALTMSVSAVAGGFLRAARAAEVAGEAAKVANIAQRAAVFLTPSQRLAAANRPIAALLASSGEQAVVDTAITLADDAIGRQNITAGEYGTQLATGFMLNAVTDSITLPWTMRDAKKARLLERAATNRKELEAQGIHTQEDAARALADDTALDTADTRTDEQATEVNRATIPEPAGQRLGGDPGINRILRDAEEAENASILDGADETVEQAPGLAGSADFSVESLPPLDTAELDSLMAAKAKEAALVTKVDKTIFPEFGDTIGPDRWLTVSDAQRLHAYTEIPEWRDQVLEVGGGVGFKDLQSKQPGLHLGNTEIPAHLKPAIDGLNSIIKALLPNSRVLLSTFDVDQVPKLHMRDANGKLLTDADGNPVIPNGIIYSAGKDHVIGVNRGKDGTAATYTVIHEIGHAIIHEWLRSVPRELLARMVAEHKEFLIAMKAGSAMARFKRFAGMGNILDANDRLQGALPTTGKIGKYAADFDEYGAEAFVRFIERKAKATNPDLELPKSVVHQIKAVWEYMKDLYRRAMEKGYLPKDTAFDEFFQRVMEGTLENDSRLPAGEATELSSADIGSMSVTSAQARKFSDELNEAAEDHLKANPIDERKLNVLAAMAPERLGALTVGLRLASSKVPILQRMAQLLTETTTGAAGRHATVSIRRDTLARELTSNSLQQYDSLARNWAAEQKFKLKDRWVTGEARRQFDKEVMLYQRRVLEMGNGEMRASAHPAVKAAAKAMESLYQRAADAERKAGTVGSKVLPASSAGYAPQRIDSAKLAAATAPQLMKIRSTLSNHWQVEYDWDAKFSNALADLYIDRARERATGGSSYGAKTVDAQGIGDVRKAIKGLLEAGTVTKQDAAKAMERLKGNDKRGLKSHRERLDIPMFAPIDGGKSMVDFFVTDQIALAHRHVQSTAGEVALTEMGIPGESGLHRLRLAAVNYAPSPSRAEMEAFDQVAAELFGRSPDSAKYSELAQSIRLTTSVLKLGGVVFNQLAESLNVIHSFGLRSALGQYAALPGKLLEVHHLKTADGKLKPNPFLHSMEADGAEMGMGDYRMNFPLRATDELLREYTESPGMINSLLKAGAMAQHKFGFMRGVYAAQHRSVAELIVKKSVRFINEWDGNGEIPRRLQDMGFTRELALAVKQAMPQMATFNGKRLVAFDVQGLKNPSLVEAYSQAVHRGTKQIIQGTFIGERNAWVHNDLAGVLTQFRTFSITSMEKQWARQRLTYDNQAVGYAYLAGLILAESTLALPIYAARVQAQALLIQDDGERKKFVDGRMNGPALVRGLLNYASSSGTLGDLLEFSLMYGGKTAGMEGARGAGSADLIGSAIPAAGVANQVTRSLAGAAEAAVDDKKDNVRVDRVLKSLPFSSLWYVVPFINATK